VRLIRISTNYPAYLQDFYAQRPELASKPYREQYQTLMADCFGWADFWTQAFGKLGYEVWEPVGNAKPMQQMWAQEQGISYDSQSWLTDIIAAQVQQFQPEIVFVNDYITYKREFFDHLRQICPTIRLVIGWCGAPYAGYEQVFKAYDLLLSNIPAFVQNFRAQGHRSEHMYHAFAPIILARIKQPVEPPINFSFTGSIHKAENFHNQREQFLKRLVEATDLRIWAKVKRPTAAELASLPRKQRLYDLVQWLKRLPGGEYVVPHLPRLKFYTQMLSRPGLDQYVDRAIADRAAAAVFGLAMYQTLAQSKITLNNHIDISANSASNMRLYEATGVGTCLLTDWQPDLQDIFEPDREVVTYKNAEEAIEKVNYLLSHEQERQQIAIAAQQRTIRDHNFDRRAEQIDALIKSSLA
jgi:spore maturation protein CgeB